MTPQQKQTLKKVLAGAVHGLLEAIQEQIVQLAPRVLALQTASFDLEAISVLRRHAIDCGCDAGYAEQRYWDFVDLGYTERGAFEKVSAELRAA